jgi:hypothetical protein
MTTENQEIQTDRKSPIRTTKLGSKKMNVKSLSLKPTRSLKKSSGLKPAPLKLK